MKSILILLVVSLLFSAKATVAGSYSGRYDQSGSVIAPIELEGNGLFNIVISLTFLSKPYDRKPFTTSEYESLINQLSVEWSDVALQTVLESKIKNISDLAQLKKKIETAVTELIEKTKKSHNFSQDTQVIFSINNFYILTPKD